MWWWLEVLLVAEDGRPAIYIAVIKASSKYKSIDDDV
jgi:hypothetical protein